MGGTRYSQQFQQQQTDGPMSASERAKKKRVRAALFPHQNAAARTRDAGRKRMVSGKDGRTQMQRTIGNVRWHRLYGRICFAAAP